MADAPVNPQSVRPTIGVVVSVQGTDPGPASGITYTVDVNIPSVGVQRVAGVSSDFGRYPDELDVRAQPVDTACAVYIMPNGFMQFDLREIPDFAECP